MVNVPLVHRDPTPGHESASLENTAMRLSVFLNLLLAENPLSRLAEVQ